MSYYQMKSTMSRKLTLPASRKTGTYAELVDLALSTILPEKDMDWLLYIARKYNIPEIEYELNTWLADF